MPQRRATDRGDAGEATMLRSQHAEATRRAVLDAARAAFGRAGYTQTSIDSIADSARVTKGAVYHHFANKEALFRAVYDEVEAEAQARAARAQDPAAPTIEQIVGVVDAYLDVALDPEIRRITLVDGPTLLGLDPGGPAEEAAHANLRAFLAGAIERGELVDVDADLLAHLVASMALLGGLLVARAGEPDTARRTLGPLLESMLRVLATEG